MIDRIELLSKSIEEFKINLDAASKVFLIKHTYKHYFKSDFPFEIASIPTYWRIPKHDDKFLKIILSESDILDSKELIMNELRRSILDPIYTITQRYSFIIDNIIHINEENLKYLPEHFHFNKFKSTFHKLFKYFFKEDNNFLRFFIFVRNSIVNYAGNYNMMNRLN